MEQNVIPLILYDSFCALSSPLEFYGNVESCRLRYDNLDSSDVGTYPHETDVLQVRRTN